MTILYSSLQLGLLYGIMVLGIYISFRILDIPDLTTEGSFAFGVAVSAVMAKAGHPYLGLLLSIVAGIAADALRVFCRLSSRYILFLPVLSQ